MKIRNGFVSNSSSSSFVIIGISVPKSDKNFRLIVNAIGDEDTKDRLANEYPVDGKFDKDDYTDFKYDTLHDLEVLTGSDDGVGDNEFVVPVFYESVGDCGDFDSKEIDLSSLVGKCDKLAEDLGVKSKAIIRVGTRLT